MIASCSANGNTYAVGPTNSPYNVLPGNATQVVWNPWQAEQVPGAIPFAEATYVLKIWDERGPGSAVKGGYMSPFSGKSFAMYRPATYTSFAGTYLIPTQLVLHLPFISSLDSFVNHLMPVLYLRTRYNRSGWRILIWIDGWKCTTCNSAMSAIAEPASLAIITTLLITVFSFWNIIRR